MKAINVIVPQNAYAKIFIRRMLYDFLTILMCMSVYLQFTSPAQSTTALAKPNLHYQT